MDTEAFSLNLSNSISSLALTIRSLVITHRQANRATLRGKRFRAFQIHERLDFKAQFTEVFNDHFSGTVIWVCHP